MKFNSLSLLIFIISPSFAIDKKETVFCKANVTDDIEHITCQLNAHNTSSDINISALLEAANKVNPYKQITSNTLSYWQAWGAKGGNGFNLGKDQGLGGNRGYSEFVVPLAALIRTNGAANNKVNTLVNVLWGKSGKMTASENYLGKSGGTGASSTLVWLSFLDEKIKSGAEERGKQRPHPNNILLIAAGGGGASGAHDGGDGGVVFHQLFSSKNDSTCGSYDSLAVSSHVIHGVYAPGKASGVSYEIGGKGGSSGKADETHWHNAEYFLFTEEYGLGQGVPSTGIKGGGGGGFGGGEGGSKSAGASGGGSFAIKSPIVMDEIANVIPEFRKKHCTANKDDPEVIISFFPEYD